MCCRALGEAQQGLDEIAFRQSPIDRIQCVSARTKPALRIDTDVRKEADERVDQMDRFRAKTAGNADSECRESCLDCPYKRDQGLGIHPETAAHAFIEQDAMDDPVVILQSTQDPDRIIAGFFHRVFTDLQDDFTLHG